MLGVDDGIFSHFLRSESNDFKNPRLYQYHILPKGEVSCIF
jgi:hypothetical protein